MEISELLAKVLANENINVSKQKVHTASFDIVNRNLVLPMWEGLEPVVETMLICHEVGHALFTPSAYVDTVRENIKISDVLNVLEDARIERLFKERYPGSRKDFAGAYKNMREADFFELGDRDITEMGFVDRINVYFKMGVLSGVKFSPAEYSYVKRATETITFEDVKALAEDILKFIAKEAEGRRMRSMDETSTVPGEAGNDGDVESEEKGITSVSDLFEDGDFDEDGELVSAPASSELSKYEPGEDDGDDNGGNAKFDPDYNSDTVRTMERKLMEVSGAGNSPRYDSFDEEYNNDVLIGYKEVLAECRVSPAAKYHNDIKYYSNKFKKENGSQVNHLVSQFELKKAAQVYALRTITKTGRLNTNIIAQYKTKDDLFLRKANVPEGKNHGMIMLLDWSGSMTSGNKIYYSIDQAVQLAMFCRLVGIPYRVFAFSSKHKYTEHKKIYNNGEGHLSLIELMSSEMSTIEHNEMIGFLESRIVLRAYGLSSTPLSPALLYMRKYIPEFNNRYRVDKLNLITFTDGENTSKMCDYYYGSDRKSVYIKDNVTKKNYLVSSASSNGRIHNINEVTALYRLLRDRFNCTITSYYISSDVREGIVNSGFYMEMDKIIDKKKFAKDGFISMTGYGRDSALVVNPKILRSSEFTVGAITSDMTPAKIAGELRKGAKSSIKGKILIEKFMDVIS